MTGYPPGTIGFTWPGHYDGGGPFTGTFYLHPTCYANMVGADTDLHAGFGFGIVLTGLPAYPGSGAGRTPEQQQHINPTVPPENSAHVKNGGEAIDIYNWIVYDTINHALFTNTLTKWGFTQTDSREGWHRANDLIPRTPPPKPPRKEFDVTTPDRLILMKHLKGGILRPNVYYRGKLGSPTITDTGWTQTQANYFAASTGAPTLTCKTAADAQVLSAVLASIDPGM